MKYMSFICPNGIPSFGRVEGDRVVKLGDANSEINDLKTAIFNGNISELHDQGSYLISDVKYLPVIPNPGKILCVGLNYETHRKETGRSEAEHPAIFTRFADTLIAHQDALICPKVSTMLDYEGEVALVISKKGKNIPKEKAAEYIAGYACFNDASIRDWQRHNIQFTPGKNFIGTGAFGPWLVTADEIDNIDDQRVVTKLNGVIVQDQPIGDMIWPINELISYISTFTPLSAGDVIVTGTPGGVGAKRNPPLWMKHGDCVEIEIGQIGKLINNIDNEK